MATIILHDKPSSLPKNKQSTDLFKQINSLTKYNKILKYTLIASIIINISQLLFYYYY